MLAHAGSLSTGVTIGTTLASTGIKAATQEVVEEVLDNLTGGLRGLTKAKGGRWYCEKPQDVLGGASKNGFPEMAPGKGRGLGAKAPEQVTPGIRKLEGQYVDDLGRTQPWEAHYDKFGRQIERTDWNAGNRTQNIPNIHYHTKEFGTNSYNHGPSRVDHAEGIGPLSQ
jgi:hypothetical protein